MEFDFVFDIIFLILHQNSQINKLTTYYLFKRARRIECIII